MLSNLLDWHKFQCSFCQGHRCRHEDVRTMRGSTPPAIPGLHSTYITERIIASQRPSTKLIERYDVIGSFRRQNITAVFNLQESQEHPNCGECKLEKSGFSYDPQTFMDHNIRYYSFAWRDLSTPKYPQFIMNIMHVIQSELERNDNGSVMIHCHAGLGRTGLVIACYLLYSQMCHSPVSSIKLVREKRPGSLQTKNQVSFVKQFYRHLCHIRQIFAVSKLHSHRTSPTPLSLIELMRKQHMYLHGLEHRSYKRIPKLICVVCERFCQVITSTATCSQHDSLSSTRTSYSSSEYDPRESIVYSVSSTYDFSGKLNCFNVQTACHDVRLQIQTLLHNMKRLYGGGGTRNDADNNMMKEHEVDLSELHRKMDSMKRRLNRDDWTYIQHKCNDLLLLTSLWIDYVHQIDHEIIPFTFIETIIETYDVAALNNTVDCLPSVESLARTKLGPYVTDIFICMVQWMSCMYRVLGSDSNTIISTESSSSKQERHLSHSITSLDDPSLSLVASVAGIVLLAHCTSKTLTPSKLVSTRCKQKNLAALHSMMHKACRYCIQFSDLQYSSSLENDDNEDDDDDHNDNDAKFVINEDYSELITDEDQVELARKANSESTILVTDASCSIIGGHHPDRQQPVLSDEGRQQDQQRMLQIARDMENLMHHTTERSDEDGHDDSDELIGERASNTESPLIVLNTFNNEEENNDLVQFE